MRGNNFTFVRAGTAIVLLAALSPAMPVLAQGVNGWSLPDPNATNAPRVQGPVDPQNPVVRPSQAAPTPVPTIDVPPPRPVAPPRATPSPTAQSTPRSQPSASARPAPSTAPQPTPETEVRAAPSPVEQPTPTASASEVPSAVVPAPAVTASEAAPVSAPAATVQNWPAWWWAIPLAVLVAATAFIFRRKRNAALQEQDWDEPAPEVPQPTPAPAQEPKPAAKPIPAPPVAAPVSPVPADDLSVTFEPLGLRLSLVYATLRYRLTVTSAAPLASLRVLGDMLGAHGSIPVDEQLAPAPDMLGVLKTLAPAADGGPLSATGELQLPLGAIRPVRQGNVSLFVPLVRLCLISGESGVAARRVFTVGVPGEGALAPLRFDTGPAEHRDLGAREVEAARGYPVAASQPEVAAG